MDEQAKPSEHVRLELQILGDTIEDTPSTQPSVDGRVHKVLVVATDPIVRLQVEDCLREIPGVQVLIGVGDGRPDLIVHDAHSSVEVTISVAPFDTQSLTRMVLGMLGRL